MLPSLDAELRKTDYFTFKNMQNIVIYDFDGNLIKESVTDFFMMVRNQFRSEGLIVLFSNFINFAGNPLFFLVNTDGQRVDSFGEIRDGDFNHLKVYEYNAIDELDNIYYASFSEQEDC